MLLDRATALSQDASRETVVLVADGPKDEADARRWIATLQPIADLVRDRGRFGRTEIRLLREDAPREVREAALSELRGTIEQAAVDGTAIVVPVLVSQSRAVSRIPEILDGLSFA